MKKILFLFLAVPLYLLSDDAIYPSSDSEEFKNRTYEFYLLDKLENAASNVITYEKRQGFDNMSKKIPNSDPVCKAYVNALNKYPIIKDFFASPMLPNSPEFTYPKWKQLDIYEYKDVYLMAAFSNRYMDFDTYIPNKAKLERDWQMEDNRSEERKEHMRRLMQMYYAKADIDNDGNIDDIVRFDLNRNVIFKDGYSAHIVAFKPTTPPFRFIDQDLSSKLKRTDVIFDIFFYKDKTYIKDLAYGLIDAGFLYMYINMFDDKQELVPLCLIAAKKK